MGKRFENLNLLRAIAALGVLVYHVIELTPWPSFPIEGPLVSFRLGWMGVDLFFVVSGFVIASSALALLGEDASTFPARYWARRIGRIVPLYALTCVLWIVLFASTANPRWIVAQLGTHLSFTHNLSPRTFDAINGVTWTLGIEMQFYLLVALAVRWIDRTPGWRIWAWCIALAWAWRAAVFALSAGEDTWHVFMRVSQLPGTLDAFGAGVFLAKLVRERGEARPLEAGGWMLAAIVTGTACMLVYWPYSDYWTRPGMVVLWRTGLAAFLLCVVAAAVRLPDIATRGPLRPLHYLGEVSYGIYLWHLFAIHLCLAHASFSPPAMLVATLLLTVGAAMLSWHLLERPVLRLAHRLGAARPNVAPQPLEAPQAQRDAVKAA